MVRPPLKDAVDQLSQAERRDLLHYLEQTVVDDFVLTEEQAAGLERRDAESASGAVAPLTVDELMRKARARVQ
jgi:predicted transcriptional regulator